MIEGGGCGGVVVQVAEGWGLVHRVGKAMQVWDGRGRGEPRFGPKENACALVEFSVPSCPSKVSVDLSPAIVVFASVWSWFSFVYFLGHMVCSTVNHFFLHCFVIRRFVIGVHV